MSRSGHKQQIHQLSITKNQSVRVNYIPEIFLDGRHISCCVQNDKRKICARVEYNSK